MPTTPETWLNEFIVNSTTTGSQTDSDITQLANGNILVAWTSNNDTGAGSPDGTDIIGQILDPLGNPIGGEFRLNSFEVDNERDVDMAALSNGGFLAVYEDFDNIGVGLTNATSIRLQRYDENGNSTGSTTIFQDNDSADPDVFDPKVAVSSATSALVVYVKQGEGSASDDDIYGKIYNPTTGTVGAEIGLITLGNDSVTQPDVTALNNSNYVITGTRNNGGDNEIIIRIVNSTGGNVLGVTTVTGTGGDGENDFDASVTALTGGGFVVTWTNTDANDTDGLFQVYTAAGAVVGGVGLVETGGNTDDDNEQIVIPLNDGGFAIFCDDDATGNLKVERFDSGGTSVGSVFTVAGVTTEVSATLLEDGRMAVSWTDLGNVHMEILDTRDVVNNGVYTPTEWQIGTVGDDVFTADLGASGANVHGWEGNDTITEAGSIKNYFGDAGNDRINITSGIYNNDLHDGGSGNDTIAANTITFGQGTIMNLTTGLIVTPSGGASEQILNFENIFGSLGSDSITGNAGSNELRGNDGNDTIGGGGGNDSMFGGSGNDLFGGGAGDDTINGQAGQDTIHGGDGNDSLRGGLHEDTLNGGNNDDFIYGGASDDVAFGGRGNDTIYGATGNDLLCSGGGIAGNNELRGGRGIDTLIGYSGNDLLAGGDHSDILSGGRGSDTL